MNRVSILCPHCRKYGMLREQKVAMVGGTITTHYSTECCDKWLLNGNSQKVIGRESLVTVLKQGSWRVGEPKPVITWSKTATSSQINPTTWSYYFGSD